jgi:hypothetical protein
MIIWIGSFVTAIRMTSPGDRESQRPNSQRAAPVFQNQLRGDFVQTEVYERPRAQIAVATERKMAARARPPYMVLVASDVASKGASIQERWT